MEYISVRISRKKIHLYSKLDQFKKPLSYVAEMYAMILELILVITEKEKWVKECCLESAINCLWNISTNWKEW